MSQYLQSTREGSGCISTSTLSDKPHICLLLHHWTCVYLLEQPMLLVDTRANSQNQHSYTQTLWMSHAKRW